MAKKSRKKKSAEAAAAEAPASPKPAAASKGIRSALSGRRIIYVAVVVAIVALAAWRLGTFSIPESGTELSGNIVAQAEDAGADAVAAKVVDFLQTRLELSYPGIETELIEVSEFVEIPGTYEVIVEITLQGQSQTIPYYATQDGSFMFANIVDLNEELPETTGEEASADSGIPKSDRPAVELFIWSYCPYGVQAQGPLAEVASLLGEDADFEAVLYHDGHGAYETQQNKIQACIQEVAGDKYWDYAAGFVESIYPACSSTRDVECDRSNSVELMKSLGIDDSAVMSCVEERGEELLMEHVTRAAQYGVTGSPTLVINGLAVNVARNAESFKAAVCEAFNEAPEGCGETLSSSSEASSGNC